MSQFQTSQWMMMIIVVIRRLKLLICVMQVKMIEYPNEDSHNNVIMILLLIMMIMIIIAHRADAAMHTVICTRAASCIIFQNSYDHVGSQISLTMPYAALLKYTVKPNVNNWYRKLPMNI